jgi:prepilin-type N-terminal cleavage/methylation domain-containing protein
MMKCFMKSNGFSLIEILIALFILGFALLALAGLMVTTTKNNSFGGHMTEAATYVQDKLEELRATPFDNVLSGNDQKRGSGPEGQGIQYDRNWNVVTSTSLDGKFTLKTITVTVNWTDMYNRSTRVVSVLYHPTVE